MKVDIGAAVILSIAHHLGTTIDYGAGLRGTNNLFHLRPLPTPLPSYIDRAGVHSSFGGYIGRNMDISALLSCSIA